MKKEILIPTVIIGLLALTVTGLMTLDPLSNKYTIGNFAAVSSPPEVGIYWDITGLEPCTNISWGDFEPGDSKTMTVYVRNEGASTFTSNITTENWGPWNAQNYIYLSWSFGEEPLKVGRIRTTDFTLLVDEDIEDITNFGFDIIVSIQEV